MTMPLFLGLKNAVSIAALNMDSLLENNPFDDDYDLYLGMTNASEFGEARRKFAQKFLTFVQFVTYS